MGRAAMQRQQSPLPTTQDTGLNPSSILQSDLTSTNTHQEAATSLPYRNPEQSTVTDDDVRHRAYQLYLQRGEVPGYELEDWLQAERDLLGD